MNILALDLGTHCGWALSENGRIESGVQVFETKRGESPGMRYLRFNRWLEEMTVDHAERPVVPGSRVQVARWDLIVFEMPHLRGGAAATVLAGMQTRVEEFCARYGIEHAAVHSATLKKFATGSGRAGKEDMLRVAVQRGWYTAGERVVDDDNEVDAICLLHFAIRELVPGGRDAEEQQAG